MTHECLKVLELEHLETSQNWGRRTISGNLFPSGYTPNTKGAEGDLPPKTLS